MTLRILARPLAKTTAQQVKPLTQKVKVKMSKKCNNVKGRKNGDDDDDDDDDDNDDGDELFLWYG